MRIFFSLILFTILNPSPANASKELEIHDIKMGAKLDDLYPWIQESCQIIPPGGQTGEITQENRIKVCLLRNDVAFYVDEFKAQKGVFRFIKNELFHAAFDFKKTRDCFTDISAFLASRYGPPTHVEENLDLIRYERRATRVTFHQLSGVPRLWWYNVPLLIEANTLIGRSEVSGR